MKTRIIILFSLIVISLAVFWLIHTSSGHPSFAVLKIHVDNPSDRNVIVLGTVNGASFWANRVEVVLNDDNSCSVKVPADQCGLLLVRSDDFLSRLIVFAGDELSLNIDNEPDKKSHIAYTGNNAAGHTYFNSLDRALIMDVNNPYASDTSAAVITHKIAAKEKMELDSMKALSSNHKITAAYARLAERNIQYYYAASLADAMYSKFFYAKYDKTGRLTFKPEYARTLEQVFSKMPVNNVQAIQSEYYKDLAEIMQEAENNKLISHASYNEAIRLSSKRTGNEQRLYNSFFFIKKNYNGAVAEYLEAQHLYRNAMRHNYEQVLVKLYNEFVSQYPRSAYIPYLQPEIDKILAFQKTTGIDFTKDQQFVANYENIRSLDELAGILKGAVYYVDIWSTYCSPCKEEFSYNPQLQQMLGKSRVRVLYISLDRERENDDWKNMIKYYGLNGLHLRASQALQTDIANRLDKNGIIAIPRYLIINDGKIVNADAERPSNTAALQKQINKYAS